MPFGKASNCTDDAGAVVIFEVLPGGTLQLGSVWDAETVSLAWCLPGTFVMITAFNATSGKAVESSFLTNSFSQGSAFDGCVGNNIMFRNPSNAPIAKVFIKQECLYALQGDMRCHGMVATQTLMPSPPPPSPMRSCYPNGLNGRFFCCSSVDSIPQCNALADLYYSTGGEIWGASLAGWALASTNRLSGSSMCSFYGIVCDDSGAVTDVLLPGIGPQLKCLFIGDFDGIFCILAEGNVEHLCTVPFKILKCRAAAIVTIT
jgi:hypothetical protein